MDFLKWARSCKLPKSLQSRQGWAEFFEYHRSTQPHIHQIEPTNHCPYNCIMCPRKPNMTRQKGFMRMDLFEKIIEEVDLYSADVKQKEIELFHFGESLLHPGLPQMVSYMSERELRATLSINPGELTPEIIDQLSQSNPYKIVVSIDSMDDQKYKMLRGNHADLQRAVKKTELLLERFLKAGSATHIDVRMIVMHENEDEVEYFTDFWSLRGAHVELRKFFPWNDEKLQSLGEIEQYPPYMPCAFSWQYLVVQFNGDVVACCRDYNGTLILGNVADQTLEEIWNGNRAELFRKTMSSGEGLDPLCEGCLKLYYTEK